MIAVVARLTAKQGSEEELTRVMTELAAQVRAQEPGCKLYQLCKSTETGQYIMLERYESREALTQHGQTAHFRASMDELRPLLETRPEIEVLEEIE